MRYPAIHPWTDVGTPQLRNARFNSLREIYTSQPTGSPASAAPNESPGNFQARQPVAPHTVPKPTPTPTHVAEPGNDRHPRRHRADTGGSHLTVLSLRLDAAACTGRSGHARAAILSPYIGRQRHEALAFPIAGRTRPHARRSACCGGPRDVRREDSHSGHGVSIPDSTKDAKKIAYAQDAFGGIIQWFRCRIAGL